MIKIDFKLPPIWDQVKDAKPRDLEGLAYYDRYELMFALGREYGANMDPENEGAYSRMLGQENMLRTLFFMDSTESVQYSGDAKALENFNRRVTESGKYQEWLTLWNRRDFFARRGVVYQVARMFGEEIGHDLKAGNVRFEPTGIMNADIFEDDDLVFTDNRDVQEDFLKAYHGIVYACARLYQERILQGKIPVTGNDEREDLGWRCRGDIPPESSMFWDTSGFNNFINQPTRRHAMWMADDATARLAEVYKPDDRDEVLHEIRRGMQGRYMSEKVRYAASMKVFAAEDVWNALSPIFAHHIRDLSLEAKNDVVMLAKDFHSRKKPVPGQLNDAIDKILASYPLTTEYKQHQVEKQAKLLHRMSISGEVSDARMNWHEYDTEKRLQFLQSVANMHAAVFGYPPCTIREVDIPPTFDVASGKKVVNYGSYEWRQVRPNININTNSSAGALHYFFEALNTVVHESQHGYQDHLARRYEQGFLKKDEPLYEQAKYFSTGTYVYVQPEQNRTHYRNNPLERDAFSVGNGVSFYIALANKEQRQEYARRMEALYEDPARYDLDLTRGFEGVPWALEPPLPEPEF